MKVGAAIALQVTFGVLEDLDGIELLESSTPTSLSGQPLGNGNQHTGENFTFLKLTSVHLRFKLLSNPG